MKGASWSPSCLFACVRLCAAVCARPGRDVDQTLVSGAGRRRPRAWPPREDRYEGIARYVRLIDWTPSVRFDRPRRSAGDRRADDPTTTRSDRSSHEAEDLMSTAVATPTEIRSFTIEIPEQQIDDLRRRIATTRLPTKELVPDRSQGVQLGDDPGARGLLGERVRLRARRGAAQRAAAVHDRDRRGRDPLHPRPVAA